MGLRMNLVLPAPLQLLDTEVNRKIKKEPPLALDLSNSFTSFPTSAMKVAIGPGEDADRSLRSQQNVDVVGELWDFT